MTLSLSEIARDDGTKVPVYASPAGSKVGLIVVQEWWGVNDQIKQTALDLGKASGVRVAIPDLYRSKIAYEAAEANHLMSELDWPGAVADIRATAAYLKSEGCSKVAVSGFCMGGALALAGGVNIDEIDASIAFYGWNQGLADVSKMKKPTQCHFGDLDEHAGFSDKATADALEALLKSSGCPLDFHRYPTQGHGFMNGTEAGAAMQLKMNRPAIEPAVIQLATDRVAAFLKAHLGA
mmetsp:Transcript_12681/g.35063  ORF Transcript_12681/g.35063 Transcript_12681/m.35063 type:complete len:237 (-) Transcript_12681:130-840(-)|eukprot:CAMPEP_0113708468 /NCGR_PEP_ID=MMETSP0038_2-20120614/28995_1 /TAXON_ID=2898 /ORGANISM="Cryptomonas paramecium" /LENGTH=236 /DNA_ID=CAMNT_0000634171 /DNA_START=1 /DNA_END=711 /DNA_ORIENTATION=+ /assembly_acc=CAM_ASM_000170